MNELGKMCGKTRVGGLRGLGLWTLGPTWMYTVCLRVGGAHEAVVAVRTSVVTIVRQERNYFPDGGGLAGGLLLVCCGPAAPLPT